MVLSTTLNITTPNIRMTPLTQVGGVVSVLVVIAIIVLVGALVHRWDRHLHGAKSHLVTRPRDHKLLKAILLSSDVFIVSY